MTTTITVKANHGWPVDVLAINPTTGEKIQHYGGRVPAGETRDFIVTSSQDLRIHEVQPAELEAERLQAEGQKAWDATAEDDKDEGDAA